MILKLEEKRIKEGINYETFESKFKNLGNKQPTYPTNWQKALCGVVVITTAQLHSTKPELMFCMGSNPACGMSEIHNGEDL